MEATKNPYDHLLTAVTLGDKTYRYYDFNKLNDPRIADLPISIKVLLECAIRNCDGFNVTQHDVEHILNWKQSSTQCVPLLKLRLKSPSSHLGSSSKISRECPSWSTWQPCAMELPDWEETLPKSTPCAPWTWSSITPSKSMRPVQLDLSPRTKRENSKGIKKDSSFCVGGSLLSKTSPLCLPGNI